VCPNCSSESARYSRRHYDGPWSYFLNVRPVKCSDCGGYFPLAADGSIRRPETDPIDLHIPFRPSELDAPGVGYAEPSFEEVEGDAPRRRPSRQGLPGLWLRGHTPVASRNRAPTSRLDVTDYRCVRCNASFSELTPLRLTAFSCSCSASSPA
jgi:hypothetical protein